MNRVTIAVIGGGICTPEEARVAETIGRELAQRGATLVCGGLGGVMEAACRGARQAGGLTVGILPGTSRHEANEHVIVPVVTGMGEARNAVVVRSAQAVIAVGGEYGTLSEIALALKMGIPVIGIGTWRLFKNDQEAREVVRCETAEDAVATALALASR